MNREQRIAATNQKCDEAQDRYINSTDADDRMQAMRDYTGHQQDLMRLVNEADQ